MNIRSIYVLCNKIFRDKNNKVVIWQSPNIILIAWFVTALLTYFVSESTKYIFENMSSALLLSWALIEILWGVNYFRRLLGLVVLGFVVARYI